MFDEAAVEAADRAARIWAATEPGPIPPGSDAHKAAFCRMLLDTHNPYKPSIIDWPAARSEARERLVSLPIWDIAVQTEGKARLRVQSYAASIADPCCGGHRAGWLRGRPPQGGPVQPRRGLWHPLGARAGLSPAARSGMGLHGDRLQRVHRQLLRFWPVRAGQALRFLSAGLVDTFEPVMQEEGRHILFFVNWVAWHRRNLPWWRRPLFAAKVLAVWVFRSGNGSASPAASAVPATRAEAQDNNFTLTGSKAVGAVDMSVATLIDVCLRKRATLAGYDSRLLRPSSCRAWFGSRGASCAAECPSRLPMKIGSEGHKEHFCRDLIASHCRFAPADLSWPELDEVALRRLRAIPFWEEVLYTEKRAGPLSTLTRALWRRVGAGGGRPPRVRGGTPRRPITRDDQALPRWAEERPLNEPLARSAPGLCGFRVWRMPRIRFSALVFSRSPGGPVSCRNRCSRSSRR